ncbi:MAG: S-layer homology domain-containing protein [Clostridiales bacterium]|nr:S-layer homology domain-containing protein [Clostridiales bacterium]
MKKIKLWHHIFTILAALLIIAFPAVAAEETLTIRGDGVEKEIVYTRAELESLKAALEQHAYSLSNNFPTEKTEYAAGLPLLYLLQQAGLKDIAQTITCIATDGYKREFTVQELLYAPRYYYPSSGDKKPVPAMVSLQSSASGLSSLEPIELKLIMGQRSPGEQTNPWFVKNLSTIEVSCEKPARWPKVTFNRASGPDGVTLQLLHENIDSVKIYYTTDGSAPSTQSKMYNISASYYQPQLNQPLLLNKTTVVQAVAIGAGKEDSAISQIMISFDDTLFSDLDTYDWAKAAIESLAAKGVVSGIGDNRFDPSGNLTRAMFITMLGRALSDKANINPSTSAMHFSDADYSSWYGSYVQWAVDQGIVSGYPDGAFKPMNPLTIEEMIVMAVRASGLSPAKTIEVSGVSGWAKPFVETAESHNLLERGHISLEDVTGISIQGQNQASRAQAAVMLDLLLK